MTDDTSQKPRPELLTELLPWFDAWKTCAQSVLSQISGQPHTFEVHPEPFNTGVSDLRYTVAAVGAVQGEMALRLPLESGIRLARKFLGEMGTPAEATSGVSATGGTAPNAGEISPDERDALEELLRQIAGLAATALGAAAGGKIQLQLSHAEAPWAWAADAVASLFTRDEQGAEIAIEIGISPALAAAVAAVLAAAHEKPSTAAPASAPVSPPEPVAASEPGTPPTNAAGYQRLFDVGLGVKLRFGTRRMLLRDVLALSSGLVVELDNALNSPVDLLLDGRIIARGDVVVIDGRYGLRVTDIVNPGAARFA